jgi:hypothetical protein
MSAPQGMLTRACSNPSADVSIRQHTPAYASIRQHTPAYVHALTRTFVDLTGSLLYMYADVCRRMLTTADVS